jgi:ABC-type lipoprotein release transport system permease subunit
LKFSNIKECIEICKNINENTYQEMLPIVEENYNKALEYYDWQKRVKDFIASLEIKKIISTLLLLFVVVSVIFIL